MVDDHSLDTQISVGEVRIGRYSYPVTGGQVNQLNLARWPPKVTFGEYSKDSDPLVSAQVASSFTGGIGNYELKEGVDDDTYWTGTLETRFPEGLTLLPLTESFSAGDDYSQAFPLGDFPAGDPSFLCAFDDDLHSWDKVTREFTLIDTLPSTPSDLGVEFDGLFYIPLGGNGYVTVDNAMTITPLTDVEPIQFIVWDLKLCALQADGEFFYKAAGGTWSASDPDRIVPTGNVPRKMVNFINSRGDPALHIVTNSLVYAYDQTDDRLYETRLDYPKHPDQGRGAVNWRGDTMFTSVGLGIHGYNGSIVTSIGPDGRYGLPAHLRGTIVDLLGEYNALLALIEGVPDESVVQAEEGFVVVAPMYGNQDTYAISNFPYQPVFGSLYRWSNSQWHPVWESEGASGVPTWMSLSEADGEYRLWWGYGGSMFTQELPVAFQNPKQSLLSHSQKFAPSGSLITGWFDADMTAFQKLASHIEVNLDDVIGTGVPGGRVTISYQIDNETETSWRVLGHATTVGLTIMPFRLSSRIVGDPFSKGRAFRRMRIKCDMYQQETPAVDGETPEQEALRLDNDRHMSPLIESVVFKFQKIPESQLSWQFSVDLTTHGGFKGEGNDVLAAYIDDLLTSDEFFEFGMRDQIYRVREAQVSGNVRTGYDERGNYQVNIVQVRDKRDNAVMSYVDYD